MSYDEQRKFYEQLDNFKKYYIPFYKQRTPSSAIFLDKYKLSSSKWNSIKKMNGRPRKNLDIQEAIDALFEKAEQLFYDVLITPARADSLLRNAWPTIQQLASKASSR